ncbi:Ultraviolet-B receptor UVR8 [Capsicum baccatum]|uniref:Ultraviolet-B receptor UVR8 n=1 Tax=Capsicum baccatum TaxID=33114 RepID=A0A2G2WSQ1_CAPBA|nr:Ultraviolet-B receptor UVR8 [Capsicum baccatum]
MVAAGAEHTAAVSEDGELYGWGWGRYGNLGLGDRNDRLVPEKVSANVDACSYVQQEESRQGVMLYEAPTEKSWFNCHS